MTALLRAELLKLARQPATLFWGFLSVPIFAILFKLVLEGMVLVRTGVNVSANSDLLLSAARTLIFSGNSIGHLLYAIGISSVFFMEYRFATWRHLVPRCSRLHLWAAKCMACLACLFAGLVLAVAADMVLNVAISLIYGPGLSDLSLKLDSFFTLMAALAIALLELAVLTAFVSAITILARSMVAAVIPAFLLPIGASLLQVYLGRTDDVLPLPSFGADALRAWLFSQGPAYDAWSGMGILAIWLIAASGIAIFTFSKQQLAVE